MVCCAIAIYIVGAIVDWFSAAARFVGLAREPKVHVNAASNWRFEGTPAPGAGTPGP